MTRLARTYANDPRGAGVTWVRNVHDGTPLAAALDWFDRDQSAAALDAVGAALRDDLGMVPVPDWQMADIHVGAGLAERIAG